MATCILLSLVLSACGGTTAQSHKAIAKQKKDIKHLQARLSRQDIELDHALSKEGKIRQWIWDSNKVSSLQRQVASTKKKISIARHRLRVMTGRIRVEHSTFWYFIVGLGAILATIVLIVGAIAFGYVAMIALVIAAVIVMISGLGWIFHLTF